jgi:hypothetical protein
VKVRFRARLVGRPKAPIPGVPSKCDPVYLPRRLGVQYEVLEVGVGCTEARDIARRWNASAQCAALVSGATCSLVGATCQSLHGGEYTPLASAGCAAAAPASRAELVRLRPCVIDAGPGEVNLWAINLECAIAQSLPIDDLVDQARHRFCGDADAARSRAVRCARIAGFYCTVEEMYGFAGEGRCVRENDAFQGFDYDEVSYDP